MFKKISVAMLVAAVLIPSVAQAQADKWNFDAMKAACTVEQQVDYCRQAVETLETTHVQLMRAYENRPEVDKADQGRFVAHYRVKHAEDEAFIHGFYKKAWEVRFNTR